MATSEAFKEPHFHVHESAPAPIQQKKPSKPSCSNMICKSLILIFVLVVIPLFPSQAPDFISQSLITNFWELLHLLFVGLAVCYGLFCRKCVETETKTHYGDDTPHSIFSGCFNFPSVFDDGFENFCISDENKALNGYQELDENKKVRSFSSRNEIDSVCENVKQKGSQIRKFKYFKGESLVVMNDRNCELQNEYKPLGLPLRSLRSGTADISEFTTENCENSRLKSSLSDDNEVKVESIRGLAPCNLDEKFEEAATPCVVPWRTRSGRIKSKDEVHNADSESHYRLHSAGEFELEHLESNVFQYPISSRNSSKSLSSSGSTLDSSSPSVEMSKPKTLDLETEKDFEGSFEHGGTSDTCSKSKKSSSIGSFTEMEMEQKSKCSSLNLKKAVQNQVGDDAHQRNGSLDLNVESSNSFRNFKKNSMLVGDKQYSCAISSNVTKITPRGKSVRTIRSNKYVFDKMKKEEKTSNRLEDDGGMFDQVEDNVFINSVKKRESKRSPVNKQKHHSEKVHPLQNQIEENKVFADNVLPPDENAFSEGVSDNSHEVSDEKAARLNEVDEEELMGSEVDRKADEFIAKFREQIRLQKVVLPKRDPCN